jgi:hypothetical protein
MQAVNEKVLRITGDREAATAALEDISRKCLTVHFDQLRLISKKASEQPTASPKPADATGPSTGSRPESAGTDRFSYISLAAGAKIGKPELDILRSTTGVIAKFIKDAKGLVGFPIKTRNTGLTSASHTCI